MTKLLLVDTDILIDVANGIPNAINRLKLDRGICPWLLVSSLKWN